MRLTALLMAIALLGCRPAAAEGWTALHTAADTGDVKAAAAILRHHPEWLNAPEVGAHTPLHVAVFSGRLAIVEFLLARGANINAQDSCGWTPLHTAANRGEKAIAELLLAHGAEVNAVDRRGQTPLRIALKYHRLDIVDVLRRQGGREAL